MHYLCKEKYRLELHWDKITYHSDEVANLQGAYFSGPALAIADKIGAPDSIDLDLTPQHLTVFDNYYIVKLQWNSTNYEKQKVFLGAVTLSNNFLKKLHKLENKDFLIIDTEKHEEKTHPFYLLYDSLVVREDQQPYKYR